MHPTKGFSLVELLVAMALVAIVTAIGIPQFQRYTANSNLKSAAREIAGDLFNARQRAVTENRDVYELVFDVAGNRYALSRTDTGTTLWTKSLLNFGGDIRLQSTNFGSSTVRFQRRGTVTVGHVILANAGGSTARVTTTFTGRTYVEFTMQ